MLTAPQIGIMMKARNRHTKRQLLPEPCFSIEPGIYLPEFGLRSEVNMLVHRSSAEVAGRIQQEMVLI